MKRSTIELAVGVFVLIGLLCVAYLSIQLGRMQFLGGDYYQLTARFVSVSGLKEGASVEIGGVQIGRVGSIALEPEDKVALVTLKIQKNVSLAEDVIASVKTSGLIGDKYISIQPGGAEEMLKPGAAITETESALDLEGIISKFAHGSI